VPTGSTARLSLFDGRHLEVIREFPLTLYPNVVFDQLSNGDLAIMLARALDDEPQAIIHGNSETSPVDLGQDALFLQAANDGTFWIGYSDIGALCGLGHAAEGIAQFANNGTLLRGMNSVPETQSPSQIDCTECLNISEFGAWAIIWMDYTIVRLDAPKALPFRTRVELPDALATNGELFLLAGGNSGGPLLDHSNQLHLLEQPPASHSRRLRRLWAGTFDRPAGGDERLIVGRGDRLHIVTDTTWRQLTIKDLLRQLAERGEGKARYSARTASRRA